MRIRSTIRGIAASVLVAALIGSQAACDPPGGGPTPAGPGTSEPAPATSTSAATTTAADPTAGWTPYRDTVDHFALRYPPAWQHRTCANGPHTGLFLAPSVDALALCNSGFTGQMSVIAVTGDQRSAYGLTGVGGLTSSSVTVGGVTGTRQSGTALAAELGPPVGTRLVVYLFFTGGRTYRCGYSQAPSGATATDVLPDFDRMITTLTFSP